MNKASCKELKRETGGVMVMVQRFCKSLNSGICSKAGRAHRQRRKEGLRESNPGG